jgi:hypothetical protein
MSLGKRLFNNTRLGAAAVPTTAVVQLARKVSANTLLLVSGKFRHLQP